MHHDKEVTRREKKQRLRQYVKHNKRHNVLVPLKTVMDKADKWTARWKDRQMDRQWTGKLLNGFHNISYGSIKRGEKQEKGEKRKGGRCARRNTEKRRKNRK